MAEDEQFLYVDEHLRLLIGEDAARALHERSDAPFLREGEGVARVPRERWQEAQRYERDTWIMGGAESTDDRNADHLEGFAGYASLRGRTFAHAIELGCGPFTNLRMIAQHCTIAECTLLDPLILDYLKHRHCTYDEHHLRAGETPLSRFLGRTLPGRAARRVLRAVAPGSLVQRIPVRELIASPIEEMPPRGPFDLVVIINVLEHCYDAARILERIGRILAPGGLLVFHDKLFAAGEIERDVATRFDAGHPLRVDRRLIEEFLERDFDALYRRGTVVPDGVGDIDLSRDGIYFIGARR